MHLHILGICGTFMGGLALLARSAGHRVSGCDANVYPPMSTQLQEQGIDLIEGFDAGQIGLGADLYVVGNVVTRGNPLMEAILDAGLPYVSGPQWLGEHLLPGRHVLAVAGTHGKTTTTAMLAHILEAAGLAPSFLVGGVPQDFGVSARLSPAGRGPSPFVIEADEYDTAFFDKRSKFVHYRPRTAILNNLEYDHADIFADLGAIETQFHHLVRTIPRQGLIIAPAGEPALDRVLERGCWSALERPGLTDGWHLGPVAADGSFEVRRGAAAVGTVRWSHHGEHNRANALAALLAARHVGVEPETAIAALGSFIGVRRRQEVRGTVRGVTVIDDFAHHPTAIATTIAGLRETFTAGRLLAVLEPRSNTMKLGTLAARLPDALARADLVYCYNAPVGRDAVQWSPAAALAPLGARAVCHTDLDALVADVCAAARPGDRILVMSNGGFGGVHQRLLEGLAQTAGAGL
ncbi:MAG: UDP-N-acetylmuramate:L-alanyl-gamma-D-glutamyl-meso-diaminopimelate ligase [Pigmentiphaga sp.]|nr:UDP-N-acetylmuramate:L-alanyl-gamma-D-glutamyl-meso-diaminopimelate ligase [Pigmentiphaga sp.]